VSGLALLSKPTTSRVQLVATVIIAASFWAQGLGLDDVCAVFAWCLGGVWVMAQGVGLDDVCAVFGGCLGGVWVMSGRCLGGVWAVSGSKKKVRLATFVPVRRSMFNPFCMFEPSMV